MMKALSKSIFSILILILLTCLQHPLVAKAAEDQIPPEPSTSANSEKESLEERTWNWLISQWKQKKEIERTKTENVTVDCYSLNLGASLKIGKHDFLKNIFHCEIGARCETKGEAFQFGLSGGYHGQKPLSTRDYNLYVFFGGLTPYPHKRPTGTRTGNYFQYPVSCGNQTSCEVLDCLSENRDKLRIDPYFAYDQNSNTYAHRILNSCGCELTEGYQMPRGVIGWKIPKKPIPKTPRISSTIIKEFTTVQYTDADQPIPVELEEPSVPFDK